MRIRIKPRKSRKKRTVEVAHFRKGRESAGGITHRAFIRNELTRKRVTALQAVPLEQLRILQGEHRPLEGLKRDFVSRSPSLRFFRGALGYSYYLLSRLFQIRSQLPYSPRTP